METPPNTRYNRIKGKINLALGSVARDLCRLCTLFTDQPKTYLSVSANKANNEQKSR